MDIGTGKVRPEEMRGIPHHCLDLCEPDRDFSAVEWRAAAEEAIAGIRSRGNVPVVCGGTGLYLDVLLFEFDVPEVPPDWDYRAKLEAFRLENGNEALWNRLKSVDPTYADELHPNNFRYVVRALEVFEKTGKSKAASRSERKLRYPDARFVTPYDGDREALYEKIDARVAGMFDDGLVGEARKLAERSGENAFGLKTIGYAEVIRYLKGELTLDECRELVRKNTRNYAKRQTTWNARYAGMPNFSAPSGYGAVADGSASNPAGGT